MKKTRKKTAGQDVLKCFHCGNDMDGRNQADLWGLLIEEDMILYCDCCTAEHNAMVAATGKAQRITTPFAPNGLVTYMGWRYDADPDVVQEIERWNVR